MRTTSRGNPSVPSTFFIFENARSELISLNAGRSIAKLLDYNQIYKVMYLRYTKVIIEIEATGKFEKD